MKEKAIYPYLHSKELEAEIWQDCVFVFDTSALLEFYFYSAGSQEKLFKNVLKPLKGRLWISSHIKFEYLKNRNKAIKNPIGEKYKPIKDQNIGEFQSLIVLLKSKFDDLKNKTQRQDIHPFLDQNIFEPVVNDIDKLGVDFKDFAEKAAKLIEKRISEIESLQASDVVFQHIEDVFSVGKEYPFSKKMEILQESEIRFRNSVPPGYKDAQGANQKEGLQRIGDLINWYQIIDYACAVQKPIILITNDLKDDWCYTVKRSNEARIERPREELIQELNEKAQVKFWMYSFPQFLYACKQILGTSIDSVVIEEAEDAARERHLDSKSKLRVDGVYFQVSDDRTYTRYLRFFEDGTAIAASVQGDASTKGVPPAMFKWFNARYEYRGRYMVLDNKIEFNSASKLGTIDYSGIVEDDHLVLDTHSNINDHLAKNQRYDFFPVDMD